MLWAQQSRKILKGEVFEEHKHGHRHALPGANVYWIGTSIGTSTGPSGKFEIDRIDGVNKLVVSYIGYKTDTIIVDNNKNIQIGLTASVEIDEVEIAHRQKSTGISLLDPIKVEKISEKELLKAACCNLSESFETNPSVDVSYTDAITGTRQIIMLGLAGPYSQITRENMPDIRGLSAIHGFTYVPGPWIESIHLNKGTGSVVNGFESITGQIDVNLKNPHEMEKLYLNGYFNEMGRLEFNANLHTDLGNQWGTALLLHANNNSIRHDLNDDGFMDHPLSRQYIALNRWEHYSDDGLHFQLGGKITWSDNVGGEMEFDLEDDEGTTENWGMHMNIERFEGWTKIGKVNPNKSWQSIGFQISGIHHKQYSFFGLRNYEATQEGAYANLIYQDIIGNPNHKIRSGASFQFDRYNERLEDRTFLRNESVPGIFSEYTYSYIEKFNVVAGIRLDYHNNYGAFITPRLHLRYSPAVGTTIRASGGRGLRTAGIISENYGVLASSRNVVIEGMKDQTPYGLNPEIAWNYGINFTHKFRLDYREGVFSLDFYRTDFQDQVVVDLDRNPREVVFYNLKGKSFSNSFQAQIDYELINRFDVRFAYRFYDVKTTYSGKLLEKPLISRHRTLANFAYETKNHWKFDYTINWQGKKRIPDFSANIEEYQLPDYSPDVLIMNAQITKTWREKFEVYVGGENLLNSKQDNPIIAANDPFGSYFDSSIIWGPIFGRSIYAGIRFKLR